MLISNPTRLARLETPTASPSRRLPRFIAFVGILVFFSANGAAKAQQQAKPNDLKIDLNAEEKRKINNATAKGAIFLKQSLMAGNVSGSHPTGRVALAGLTLLECDVPAKDPAIVKTASLIRAAGPWLHDTYSLSLAIMFLDKLGSPQDEKLIRTFAARLVAGQNSRGGWTYDCPVLSAPDEKLLLTMLKDLPQLKTTLSRPLPLLNGLANSPSTDLPKALPESGAPKSPNRDPLPGKKSDLQNPLIKEPPASSGPLATPLEKKGLAEKGSTKVPDVKKLPRTLQNIPALLVVPGKEPRVDEKKKVIDDNSNTQFAILGLWNARKHGVPMERTLVLVERRFRSLQNADGSWGYHLPGHEMADSMTCTGLLGMALAMGADLQLQGQAAGQALADPTVKNGLAYLSLSIGKVPAPFPIKGKKSGHLVGADARGDLYYLWSVERVAVAYGLPKIGQKDWYRWGAGVILANQQIDGSWRERYAGIPDTAFALLFLVRANPLRDIPRLTAP